MWENILSYFCITSKSHPACSWLSAALGAVWHRSLSFWTWSFRDVFVDYASRVNFWNLWDFMWALTYFTSFTLFFYMFLTVFFHLFFPLPFNSLIPSSTSTYHPPPTIPHCCPCLWVLFPFCSILPPPSHPSPELATCYLGVCHYFAC